MSVNLNVKNMEDYIEDLVSACFRISRIDGSHCVEPIRLMGDGSISGHSNANEHSWKLIDGHVAFLSKDGRVSTLFDSCLMTDGKFHMSGDFLFRPHLKIKHQLTQIDFSWEKRERTKMLTRTLLKDGIQKYKWAIGDHTYGSVSILEPRMANVKIGKFCSIAGGVTIILGNHRTDTVTTYPFSSLKQYWPGARRDAIEDHSTNGDVVIGNDVWIGRAVTIMSGVKIGDGSVIAANSLVNKDVEPYSIVAGTPAKKIKLRHTEKTVSALLKIKWWDWDDSLIDSRLSDLLSDVDSFVLKYTDNS